MTLTIQTKGYITIEIGAEGDKRSFTLDGTVGNQIQVGWRAKDGDEELPLGSLPNIIVSVYTALGGSSDFGDVLNKRLDDLAAIAPLTPIVSLLRDNAVYITDLAFSATYTEETGYTMTDSAFGFRVEFESAKVGPLTLRGFGVLFEYTPTPEGLGAGTLTQRALSA